MQSWQTVVVVCVATLLARGALGHPRALEEVKEDVEQKLHRGGVWTPADNADDYSSSKNEKMQEDEFKKIPRSAAQEEEEKKEKMLGVVRQLFPTDAEGVNLEPKEVGLEKVEQKEEDSARSKKSTDVRELMHTVPATTVCIQVRSDRVCGPPVAEKMDEKPAPQSARYSYGPTPSQAYYNPMYPQGEKLPLPFIPPRQPTLYVRASPQDIKPSRPSAASGQIPQQMTIPQQSQGPVTSPFKPRGFLVRTQPEDDNSLKTPEATQPAQPNQVLIPKAVMIRNQFYQPFPFGNNLLPAQSALRLNCALQPDGSQVFSLPPYVSPLLRNSLSSGYLPAEVIIPGIPSGRMAQGLSDSQAYYYDSQGRSAQPEEMLGSPYEYDPMVGATFVGEDGQVYQIDDSQGRSAADSLWEQGSPRASSLDVEDLQKQLNQRSEQLARIEKQLKDIQHRSLEEEKRKASQPLILNKESAPSARESMSELSDDTKKPEQNKNKRHSSRHSKRR